ncbi:SixA phosphatase family protein [Enhygromyxa salina]|nr:histidine phosphatase family protein [Enhygromyxa salina]
MLLTLVRHGDAESSTNDLRDIGRCLSIEGRAEASATGQALASRAVAPSHAWSSPLVRAVQTAELIVAALDFGGVIEARDDLFPDSRPPSLFNALAELPADADLLVVGHMPYMAAAASALLDSHVGGFATGAAFRFEIRGLSPTRAALKWRWQGRFVD